MRNLVLVLALLAAPALARAEVRLDGGQADHGVVVEARLGSDLVSVATGTTPTSTLTFAGVQGGIFGGYKIKRFIFGLGFDLARVASGSSTGNTSTSAATTSIMFTPGLSVAILRSADKRVELFGQFDMGFGDGLYLCLDLILPPLCESRLLTECEPLNFDGRLMEEVRRLHP